MVRQLSGLERTLGAALFGISLFGADNVKAETPIFSDSFEIPLVSEFDGFYGTEGDKMPTAKICEVNGPITNVNFNYRGVDGTIPLAFPGLAKGVSTWQSRPMEPVGVGKLEVDNKGNVVFCQTYQLVGGTPVAITYDGVLFENGLTDSQIEVWIADLTEPEMSPMYRTNFTANEDTAQGRIEALLDADPNVFVVAYDGFYDNQGNQVGPLDAFGFFFSNGKNFAIEYNGEGRTSQELLQLQEDYEANSGGNNTFYALQPSSVENLNQDLTDILDLNAQ